MSPLTIFIGLIVLIVLSPMAVGSVYVVTYSSMELIIFSLLLLHLWTIDFSRPTRGASLSSASPFLSTAHAPDGAATTSASGEPYSQGSQDIRYLYRTLLIMSPFFLFLLFCLFQMLPLGFPLLGRLSPRTAALYTQLGLSLGPGTHVPGSLPLTLSLSATSAAMLKWLAYGSVFFLAATFAPLSTRRTWTTLLFVTIFIVGFGQAIYGLYLYLNQPDTLLWFKRSLSEGAVAGTYINRNHFACLMNMCIPVSAGLLAAQANLRTSPRGPSTTMGDAVFSNRSLFLYFLFLGLIVMVLALIFSMSRMGQLSLVAAIVLAAMLYRMAAGRGERSRHRFVPLTLFMVFGLALLWGVWKGAEPVANRWQVLESEYEQRLDLWTSTSEVIRDFPLFGTGLGTYELANARYKPQRFHALVLDHAHNDYLELLSEVGLIGFIFWLAFFLLCLISGVRAWSRHRSALSRCLGIGAFAAAAATLIHSLADFNLQIPANTMLLFLIMGLFWRVSNQPSGRTSPIARRKHAA